MTSIVLMLIILLFCIYILIRNIFVYNNHAKITDAIYKYKVDMIGKSVYVYEVDYEDMEPYNKTLWRLYDFGYKNILPKEKYEIIKPYL